MRYSLLLQQPAEHRRRQSNPSPENTQSSQNQNPFPTRRSPSLLPNWYRLHLPFSSISPSSFDSFATSTGQPPKDCL